MPFFLDKHVLLQS